jgi:hypothetical protein
MVLRARSRCGEIQRSSSVCEVRCRSLGGLIATPQCLTARRVSGSAGWTVTAGCGELGGKAAMSLKKIISFQWVLCAYVGQVPQCAARCRRTTGKSSRVVARGASMLREQMSVRLTRGTRIGPSSGRSLFGRGGSRPLLGKVATEPAADMPCGGRLLRSLSTVGNGPVMCSSARLPVVALLLRYVQHDFVARSLLCRCRFLHKFPN